VRWGGTYEREELKESVLLVGATGLKVVALKMLIGEKVKESPMRRETQLSDLVGWSVVRWEVSGKKDVERLWSVVGSKLQTVDVDEDVVGGIRDNTCGLEELKGGMNDLREKVEGRGKGNVKDIWRLK
jgi:hypothetical protein